MDALQYAEQIAYSSKEVLHFTYEKSKEYADKPGVYCECGCAAGAQIIAMAAGAPNKTIYAFDSFEGIPLPSNKDDQMPGIKMLTKEEQSKLPNPGEQVLESSGATVVPLEDFKNHIDKAIGIEYEDAIGFGVTLHLNNGAEIVCRVGWFEEVLPVNPVPPISILRLDGDLYNSTYVCLKYLYPKVIDGGLIVVDDWALPGCQQAVRDYYKYQMGEDGEADYIFYDWDIKSIDKNSGAIYWTK